MAQRGRPKRAKSTSDTYTLPELTRYWRRRSGWATLARLRNAEIPAFVDATTLEVTDATGRTRPRQFVNFSDQPAVKPMESWAGKLLRVADLDQVCNLSLCAPDDYVQLGLGERSTFPDYRGLETRRTWLRLLRVKRADVKAHKNRPVQEAKARKARSSGGRAPAQDAAAQELCVLKREGKRWRYSFGGKSGSCRDSYGMVYIRELLSRPNQRTDVVQLEAAIRGGVEPPPLARSPGVNIVDDQAIKDLKERARDLVEDIATARQSSNQQEVERLEKEADGIRAELKRVTGLGSRRRRTLDEVNKARKRVGEAITTAIRAIKEDHKDLAAHLNQHIRDKGGQSPVYQLPPTQALTWDS